MTRSVTHSPAAALLLLVLGLTLGGHEARAIPASQAFGASSTEWTYMGPGGLGTNLPAVIHPRYPATMLVGSNQSGLYQSDDGGQTFEIASDTLRNLVINDITFAKQGSTEVAILASTQGIYRSTGSQIVSGAVEYLGWQFIELGGHPFWGTEHANISYRHIKSMRVVTASTHDPQVVWAGAGEYKSDMHINYVGSDVQRPDETSVWLSTDGGQTWSPSLRINEPRLDTSTGAVLVGEFAGAHVFEIMAHPSDADSAWVATNLGLYRTEDAGQTWTEVGINTPRSTTDGGANWTPGTANTCTADCLPINDMGPDSNNVQIPLCDVSPAMPAYCEAETHPHIVDLSYAVDSNDQLVIFASFWERHHLNEVSGTIRCPSNSPDNIGKLTPTELANGLYRGGPWRSDDGGSTWSRALDLNMAPWSAGEMIYMRCGATTESVQGKQSQYPWVHANPTDPDHLLFVGYKLRGGLWESVTAGGATTYTWWSDYLPGPGNCSQWISSAIQAYNETQAVQCFEGERAGGIGQKGRLPHLQTSDVYWPDSNTSYRPDGTAGRPVVLWGTKRGAILGYERGSGAGVDFYFDHLANNMTPGEEGHAPDFREDPNIAGNDGPDTLLWEAGTRGGFTVGRWTSTGLECSVATGPVIYRADINTFYGGTGDSGLFLSDDGGTHWQPEAEKWVWDLDNRGVAFRPDRGDAMAFDEANCRLYVSTCTNSSSDLNGQFNQCTVMVNDATDGQGNCGDHVDYPWVAIGGQGYAISLRDLGEAASNPTWTTPGVNDPRNDNGLPFKYAAGDLVSPYINRIESMETEGMGNDRVIIGTQGSGLWVYDPSQVGDKWGQIGGTAGCPIPVASRIRQIHRRSSAAGADLLVTVSETAADQGNGDTSDGVYLVQWQSGATTPTCAALKQRVASGDAVAEPAASTSCLGGTRPYLTDLDALVPVIDSNGDVARLVASRSESGCSPRIYTLDVSSPGPPPLDALPIGTAWQGAFDLEQTAGDTHDLNGQLNRRITSIVHIPGTDVLVAGAFAFSRYDFEVSPHIYISLNGGDDWYTDSMLGLPRLAMRNILGLNVVDDILIASTAGAAWWFIETAALTALEAPEQGGGGGPGE